MANRYLVMGQVFIANGTTTTDSVGRQVADKTITITGGAGNFTIYMTQGITGTVTSGSVAITGSVVTLSAGLNTLTADGNGDCTLDITIGTAANWNHVDSWSAASGGTGGASVPTSSDNVYFGANSFTRTTQVLTIDAAASCLDMDWTGATNTPTFTRTNALNIYGSLTFIAGMSTTGTTISFLATSPGKTITTGTVNAILTAGAVGFTGAGGGWTLQDAFNSGVRTALHSAGALNTNGQTVSSGIFNITGAGVKTLTLGSSVINCDNWVYDGSNLTVTANTATINVSGTGAFAGGDITTYHNVNLNGTAHTVSGNGMKIKRLGVGRGAAVTITGTAGETYTISDFWATNNTNVLTMVSTGAAWTIQGNRGYCELDYTNLTNVVAGDKYLYYAGDHSTDGTGNTNWIFSRKVRSSWKFY